ncbi:MAG: protein translocase subunit SecF [Pseudomonadales bacterium]|nr:protein translocase subunit SecF [Pseudomonadales bacterium]
MSTKTNIDFMGKRKIAAILSVALVLASIASLTFSGLKLGLDFTGGTLVEVGYETPANIELIRQQLQTGGYPSAVVQNFGSETDVLVRLQQEYKPELGDQILATLQQDSSTKVTLRRSEFVGAQVGDELREQGGLGMLLALFVVMIYVAFRFQFKFSVGAVVALAHDVIITLGIFSLLGFNFDLTVLAALLAVIGYSLNDTIVVSDRIRENFRKVRKQTPLNIINISLNETLSRTIITSLTTLLVLVTLLLLGGELIRGFAIALSIGVIVGTYSSIYVASNILLALGITSEDLALPVKEGHEIDGMP